MFFGRMNAHKHPNENNVECDASCYGSISALDGLSFLVVKILAQRLFISYAESSLSDQLLIPYRNPYNL